MVLEKNYFFHKINTRSTFAVSAFKYSILPHFLFIMKNYRLIPNQLAARGGEQVLHSRLYQRENETHMTFQGEL